MNSNEMKQAFEELKQRVVITERQISDILARMDINSSYVELHSFNDALNRISELDCNNPSHEELLYSLAFTVGEHLDSWDCNFDLAKNTLVSAARNVGFRSKFLADDIDGCLIEGMAEYIENTGDTK